MFPTLPGFHPNTDGPETSRTTVDVGDGPSTIQSTTFLTYTLPSPLTHLRVDPPINESSVSNESSRRLRPSHPPPRTGRNVRHRMTPEDGTYTMAPPTHLVSVLPLHPLPTPAPTDTKHPRLPSGFRSRGGRATMSSETNRGRSGTSRFVVKIIS